MINTNEDLNGISISGRIINEPVRYLQWLMFTVRHVHSSKEPPQFYECMYSMAFKDELPPDIISKGNEVVVKGIFGCSPYKKNDRRYYGNNIEVESVEHNTERMVRTRDGNERLLPTTINDIRLNGFILDDPVFGRGNSWVRFKLYHDRAMGSFTKQCLMFAPKEGSGLPHQILRKGAKLAILGSFHMNTFQNPTGKEEIYVDELLSDEKYVTDIRFEEKEAPQPRDRRKVNVIFEGGVSVAILPDYTTYGKKSSYIEHCDYPFWTKCNSIATLCQDWLHGADTKPDTHPFITQPPAGIKVRCIPDDQTKAQTPPA